MKSLLHSCFFFSVSLLLHEFGGICDGWQPPTPIPSALVIENQHGPGSVSITIPSYLPTTTDSTYPSLLHSIHILPLLSDGEVSRCRSLAQRHAAATGCWQQPDATRHVTYPTCDFPVEQCAPLQQYLEEEVQFDQRLFTALQRLYDIPVERMWYLDLFCAHYQADGSTTMDRLEAHRDGSLLSFTILLNDPSEFQGGGTFFDALQRVASPPHPVLSEGVVRPVRAGDAVLHCGKVLHGGHVVTAGSRTVLVGFVDVLSPAEEETEEILRPGVLGNACRDWGRLDVANYRQQRQQRRRSLQRNYWFRRPPGSTWQSRGTGFSNTCPPYLASVRRLADPEVQRRRRLEIEDRFLRSILLTDEERCCMSEQTVVGGGGGDYTILSE